MVLPHAELTVDDPHSIIGRRTKNRQSALWCSCTGSARKIVYARTNERAEPKLNCSGVPIPCSRPTGLARSLC